MHPGFPLTPLLRTIALGALLIFALLAEAAPRARLPVRNEGTSPTFEQRTLEAGKRLGRQIDRAAEAIDITLAGKKYTRKKNTSSLSVTQAMNWKEGGEYRPSTSLGVNLRLPNVERRFQLRFASYDEESEQRDISQTRVRTQPREQDFNAGFLFFQKLGNVTTEFQPQLQLKDPLEMKYLLTFDSSSKAGNFKLKPKLQFFADPKKGTGQYFKLEMLLELNEFTDLVIENSEEYQGGTRLFLTQNAVSIDHSLSDRKAVSTTLTSRSNSAGKFHHDALVYAATYKEVIYKDQLSYLVSPYITFERIYRYKGRTGMTVSLTVTF